MREANEFSQFKRKIYLYGLIIAAGAQLISLIFLGWEPQFTFGLALGTLTAIVNFVILSIVLQQVVDGTTGKLAVVGNYIIRMLIYGGVFYICVVRSYVCGLGALIGFLTLKAAIYYVHGFKPKFSRSSAEGKELNEVTWTDFPGRDRWWGKLFLRAAGEDPEELQEAEAAAEAGAADPEAGEAEEGAEAADTETTER
ncbi:MAG: ATP synthase subunit I [Bacillota bacterium]|nr:ATP synthase subunit I [Bacillota bacterium]